MAKLDKAFLKDPDMGLLRAIMSSSDPEVPIKDDGTRKYPQGGIKMPRGRHGDFGGPFDVTGTVTAEFGGDFDTALTKTMMENMANLVRRKMQDAKEYLETDEDTGETYRVIEQGCDNCGGIRFSEVLVPIRTPVTDANLYTDPDGPVIFNELRSGYECLCCSHIQGDKL